jgi:D-amino-acid dehydrogenase
MKRKIAVIGAGIVGAACAARLVMAGEDVTLIDRVGPGESCSFGNAGGLSPSISFPLATPGMFRQIPGWLLDRDGPLVLSWKHLPAAAPWLARFLREGLPGRSDRAAQGVRTMMRETFEDYEPLFAFAGAKSLIHKVGQLYLFSTEEGFAKEEGAIRVRRELGFAQEVLDADGLRKYEPALAPIFRRGVFLPTHGHCSNPQRLVQLLVEACAAVGARFVRDSIASIEIDQEGARLRGASGTYTADRVVLAGGIWSNELVRRFGVSVPLESHRGYHIQVPYGAVRPTRNVAWSEMKTLVTPMEEGIRIAGTAEMAGVEPPPTARRFELLRELGRQIYPALDTAAASEWMGHRPCTPDSLPVLGALAAAPQIVCAFGHGHIGLSGAAYTGRVIQEIVAGTADAEELKRFSYDRFH